MLLSNLLFSLILLTEPVNGSVDIYNDEITYTNNSGTLDSIIIATDTHLFYYYFKIYIQLELYVVNDYTDIRIFITKPDLNGSYKIFDPVGNLITSGDIINSDAIWDKRNTNYRYLSSGSFVIFVNLKDKDNKVYNLKQTFILQ